MFVLQRNSVSVLLLTAITNEHAEKMPFKPQEANVKAFKDHALGAEWL